MKILIPPSKEMDNSILRDGNKNMSFLKNRDLIINCLKKYSAEDLVKTFKMKENIAEKTFYQWQNIYDSKASKAIYFFNGLMFRNMGLEELGDEKLKYIEENIRIISPLYGVIKPFDEIWEHRLDFSKNIYIDDNTKLVKFWKEDISNYLLNEDDIFINLLSDEFKKVLNEKVLDKCIFVKFNELKDGNIKTHSTISKKARGLFIKFLAENNICKLEELKKFNYDSYYYDEKKSNGNNIFFIKNVN